MTTDIPMTAKYAIRGWHPDGMEFKTISSLSTYAHALTIYGKDYAWPPSPECYEQLIRSHALPDAAFYPHRYKRNPALPLSVMRAMGEQEQVEAGKRFIALPSGTGFMSPGPLTPGALYSVSITQQGLYEVSPAGDARWPNCGGFMFPAMGGRGFLVLRRKSVVTYLGYEVIIQYSSTQRIYSVMHSLKFMYSPPDAEEGVASVPCFISAVFGKEEAASIPGRFRKFGKQKDYVKPVRKGTDGPYYQKVLEARAQGLPWAMPKAEKAKIYGEIKKGRFPALSSDLAQFIAAHKPPPTLK